MNSKKKVQNNNPFASDNFFDNMNDNFLYNNDAQGYSDYNNNTQSPNEDNDYDRGERGEAGGGDMGVLRNAGNTASFGSGVIGLTQIGMLEYRMSLPLSSKIGTFSRFSSTYGSLGKFGGRLGYAGAGINLISNVSAVRTGEIGVGRFGYRLSSLGASIGIVEMIGGPWGAVAGAAVGGISAGFEYIYDNMLVPGWNEINRQIYNFENGIRNGWYPGR